ncbi:MAG: hypothetical protein ABSD59_01370 [Terracidiphilus sp.]|jgi:hypothetical protein
MGIVVWSEWLIGCGRFERAISAIPRALQFKVDLDYVGLIAREKSDTGLGMSCHVSYLRPKGFVLFVPLISVVQDFEDTLDMAIRLPKMPH